MDLRCPNGKLHGKIIDKATGELDVACDNRLCGKRAGVVVIHRFDLSTGKVIKTKQYQDPAKLFSQKKEETSAADNRSAAVRAS